MPEVVIRRNNKDKSEVLRLEDKVINNRNQFLEQE